MLFVVCLLSLVAGCLLSFDCCCAFWVCGVCCCMSFVVGCLRLDVVGWLLCVVCCLLIGVCGLLFVPC